MIILGPELCRGHPGTDVRARQSGKVQQKRRDGWWGWENAWIWGHLQSVKRVRLWQGGGLACTGSRH